MKVTIEVNDEDVMPLLLAGKADDPTVLPYARVVADAVAAKLGLSVADLAQMREAYTAAGQAMQVLQESVMGVLREYQERGPGEKQKASKVVEKPPESGVQESVEGIQ